MMVLIFGLLTAISWLIITKSIDRITSIIQIVHEIYRSEKGLNSLQRING
jgi:predicted PurR-regulated permease PerM